MRSFALVHGLARAVDFLAIAVAIAFFSLTRQGAVEAVVVAIVLLAVKFFVVDRASRSIVEVRSIGPDIPPVVGPSGELAICSNTSVPPRHFFPATPEDAAVVHERVPSSAHAVARVAT